MLYKCFLSNWNLELLCGSLFKKNRRKQNKTKSKGLKNARCFSLLSRKRIWRGKGIEEIGDLDFYVSFFHFEHIFEFGRTIAWFSGFICLEQGTIDILGPRILCCGDCSVWCPVFHNIPGHYLLNVSSTPSTSRDSYKCLRTLSRVSWERDSSLVENPRFRRMQHGTATYRSNKYLKKLKHTYRRMTRYVLEKSVYVFIEKMFSAPAFWRSCPHIPYLYLYLSYRPFFCGHRNIRMEHFLNLNIDLGIQEWWQQSHQARACTQSKS